MKLETIGYLREYYQNGKFIGAIRLDQPDREKEGYYGTTYHQTEKPFKIGRKKIQAGQYKTRMIRLSGKVKEKSWATTPKN